MKEKSKKVSEKEKKHKEKRKQTLSGNMRGSKSEKKESLLINKSELKRELLARKNMLLCLPTFYCMSSSNVGTPHELEELLEEFDDVFPKELPHGLPPLRGIKYQMDLIPGSQLPNRPPYKTTPQETQEISKQVHEELMSSWRRDGSKSH